MRLPLPFPILVLCCLSPLASLAAIDLRATERFAVPGVTDIRHAGDGSNRLFLTQQEGTVRVVRDGVLLPEPFIDVRERISLGSERGLLSIAFPPDYAASGEFYLYFTDPDGRSQVSRFSVGETPDVADPASEELVIGAFQPRANHNGGRIVFGPDGMLYVAIGDGGGGGDPEENGQDGSTRLGALLRIDVLGDAPGDATFAVPPDNPFLDNPDVLDELWAIGLRNPWRISFDPATGALYIADVGQSSFEEINVQPAGVGGQNYGWNLYEGNACFTTCTGSEPVTFPVHVYGRDDGCSITGGEVYRGPDYPALDGVYLFSDFCSGRIWGLSRAGGGWQVEELLDTPYSVRTFGTDERGNVYVAGSTQVALLSDGEPVAAGGLPLDGSFSGTYVVDGLPEQGFFVTVDERADGSRFAFVAWYTFDAGMPLWLVGVGEITGGDDTVEMVMQAVDGPDFLEFDPPPARRVDFGTMRFRGVACDTLQADYDFPGRATGSFTLERLTGIEGRDCPAAR